MGFADGLQKHLIQTMDSYEHKSIKASIARTLAMFKTRHDIIYIALLKSPDREGYVEYSIPTHVTLPNGVIVRKERLKQIEPYLNDDGQFLLEKAVTQSNLKCGVIKGRVYGEAIDNVLRKHKRNPNIFIGVRTNMDKQILPMLKANRLDYIIGYPPEAQYYTKAKDNGLEMVSLPVKGMPRYQIGYVAAPKTQWGRDILKKINPLIRKYRTTREFQSAYEFWLDEKSITRYRKYTKEVF